MPTAETIKCCSPLARGARVTNECPVCGCQFSTPIGRIRRGQGKFCSATCARTHQFSIPALNPNWKGGVPKVVQTKRYRERHPEKIRAHSCVKRAIKRGDLIRATICEACGKPHLTEGHHEDYNQPLEVEWLCRTCHRRVHKQEEK